MVMPVMENTQTRRSKVLGWLNHGLSVAGALTCLGLLVCLAAVTVFNLSLSEVMRGAIPLKLLNSRRLFSGETGTYGYRS